MMDFKEAGDQGVLQLLHGLCSLQCKGITTPRNLTQPRLSKQQKIKQLQLCAYNTLFKHLKGPHGVGKVDFHTDNAATEVEQVYEKAFDLRLEQRYDDADRLECLVEKLHAAENVDDRSILRLLLLLSGTGSELSTDVTRKLPLVFPNKDDVWNLPAGPRSYGDSRKPSHDSHFYMHYPSHVFRLPEMSFPGAENDLTQDFVQLQEAFHCEPGTGLRGKGWFNVTGTLKDEYEQHVSGSLFGALMHGKATHLDVKLELPDIDTTHSSITLMETNKSSEDEGFVESASSGSCDLSLPTPVNTVNIWEAAVSAMGQPRRFVWEQVGVEQQEPLKPYLCEAGPAAFDELYRHYLECLTLIDTSLILPARHFISTQQLVHDSIHMLIGAPSQTFVYDTTSYEYIVSPGTLVSGLSTEAIANATKPLITTGTYYLRLHRFASAPVFDSQSGLVFEAFTGAVRKYLHHYRACVLILFDEESDLTLMGLVYKTIKLCNQIRYLSELCMLDQDASKQRREDFPMGVKLLSYLYRETLSGSATEHYAMLLSLLNTASKPYLLFIQDWVFNGVYRDVYAEFMIQINEEFLQYRDKHFWSHGYRLSDGEDADAVPLFLTDLANDLVVCGKSINLLRRIAPQHFLLRVEVSVPTVMLTFSEQRLDEIEHACQTYLSRMQEIARQTSKSRAERLSQEAADRQAVLIHARREAGRQIELLQARLDKARRQQDAKKRKLFAELKQNMETDLKRRASDKEAEMAEDNARMEEVDGQELLEANLDADLERQAREELIEYYERLGAEAGAREQKALWHVRRRQLQMQRQQFLEDDEQHWQQQIQQTANQSPEDEVFPQDDAALPKWARMQQDQPTRHVGDTDEQNTLQQLERTDFGLGELVTDEMPNWAKKAVESGNTEPVLVDDLPVRAQGHPSDSSVGLLLQGDVTDVGENVTSEKPHQPSPSSVQKLLYGAKGDTGKDAKENVMRPIDVTKDIKEKIDKVGDCTDASVTKTDALDGNVTVSDVTDMSRAKLVTSPMPKIKSPLKAIPRTTTKQHIKMIEGHHATAESGVEADVKSSIKVDAELNIMKETEEIAVKSSIMTSGAKHATMESTEEISTKSSIRSSGAVSVQTVEVKERQHLKTVDGKHANVESVEVMSRPNFRANLDFHATKESAPKALPIYKPSVYGHISEISRQEFTILAPKLRRTLDRHASKESDTIDRSFTVKSGRRKVKDQEVSLQTTSDTYRPKIHMSGAMHSSKESDYVDHDGIRLEKFKVRNPYGHSTDSSVQRLLYGTTFGSGKVDAIPEEVPGDAPVTELSFWSDSRMEPYQDNFEMLNKPPVSDLLAASLPAGILSDVEEDIAAHHFASLPSLIKRSVTAPLAAQVHLVNKCVINHFLEDLSIEQHFRALRRFLLMKDGEFSQSLTDQLFEKLGLCPRPREVLNPVFLNNTLTRALQSSIHGDHPLTQNLSFVVRYMPEVLYTNVPTSLDCLELTFKVEWPLNIVITDNCLVKYGRVFSLMLQLKRTVWTLKDMWHQLKRDAKMNAASSGAQFRQLQLYRHEMQHFVKVMQGYLANQVIQVSWQEFQEQLTVVSSLDDLHQKHSEYLDKCLFRCLLSKKAAPVMKIIQDIFGLILKMRSQLTSEPWRKECDTIIHPAFTNMCATYKSFSDYSRFLFRVVTKLAMRGYQPHLQELLFRLNFNDYYKSKG